MKQFLRAQWREYIGAGVDEQLEGVSADLPYELQSKMFDQLATVSVAGVGLAVTLIGSLLRNAPPLVWLSVVFFGMAALTAVGGNKRLIDSLFRRRPTLRRSKLDVQLAMGLIGVAIGILSMSTYFEAERSPTVEASAKAKR